MSEAKEYREFAEECMDWARTARSDKERGIFLQMARTWIEAAQRSAGTEAMILPSFETQNLAK